MNDKKKGLEKAMHKFVEKRPKKAKSELVSYDHDYIDKPYVYLNEKTAPDIGRLDIGDMVTIKAKVTGVNSNERDGKKCYRYDLTCEEYSV